MNLREIVVEYFDFHPVEKAELIRKGKLLLRSEWRETHYFVYERGETKCMACGQDWYADYDGPCPGYKRIEPEDAVTKICCVLCDEHKLYKETIAKCERLVKSEHKDWSTLTGEKIAILHHTHGCGVEELEWILNSSIPKSLRVDYEAAMEVERTRSRNAQVKEVITIKI